MSYKIEMIGEQYDGQDSQMLVPDDGIFNLGEFTLKFGVKVDFNTKIQIEYIPEENKIELLNGRLDFHPESRLLRHNDPGNVRKSVLTPNESTIFEALVSPIDTPRSKEELVDLIATKKRPTLHTATVHVSKIRKALQEKETHLRTIRGFGFIFDSI